MEIHEQVQELLSVIDRFGSAPMHQWPADASFGPADLGLLVLPDERLVWEQPPHLFSLSTLSAACPDVRIHYQPIIASTNTWLMELGAHQSIAQNLCLTEFQYGGRGRRGRHWLSPFARNIAITLGIATGRSPSELGGLTLVVGLALIDVLHGLGLEEAQLKWPNDVLVGGHKLAGVLVELVHKQGKAECAVGIGVNVKITDQEATEIGALVTDLHRHGIEMSRTDLVIRIINTVHSYLALFERQGFSNFVEAFNSVHAFHGHGCQVLTGNQDSHGFVTGVGENGELLLQTADGLRHFFGGEVSLRRNDLKI